MTLEELRGQLQNNSVKNIILDTDTYNEVDDQFALSYALLRNDRINLLSVNAAPFLNFRSTSPEDGMNKSYDEIIKILSFFKNGNDIAVYHGSTCYLSDKHTPIQSEACDNIINTVLSSKDTVYVVAIGAITNVASAIIKCPEIINNMAVIWLGGHSREWEHNREFNLYQDVNAANVIFECGVNLIQLPCFGVVSEFHASLAEFQKEMGGSNTLCDYLIDIVRGFSCPNPEDRKVIWDVTAVAALALPESLTIEEVYAKSLKEDASYSADNLSHKMLYVTKVNRDMLFEDLFKTLSEGALLN